MVLLVSGTQLVFSALPVLNPYIQNRRTCIVLYICTLSLNLEYVEQAVYSVAAVQLNHAQIQQ